MRVASNPKETNFQDADEVTASGAVLQGIASIDGT
jgi:hypothetical protein